MVISSLYCGRFSLRYSARLVVFVAFLTTSGCGSSVSQYYFGDLFSKSSSTTERTPNQLAVDGMHNMREGNYDDALKDFQQLKEHYPYSQYAALAELELGNAHFQRKEYNEAAMAYEEFARLHPRNEVIPYVLYQIGMCHFLLFSTTDRDQQETRLAMESFQRLIQAYPQTDYAQRAKKQLFECQKRIVAHEFHVGQFYYRLGEYASAKERLEPISRMYPQAVTALGYKEPIEEMIADSQKHIGQGEKKPSIWTRLGF